MAHRRARDRPPRRRREPRATAVVRGPIGHSDLRPESGDRRVLRPRSGIALPADPGRRTVARPRARGADDRRFFLGHVRARACGLRGHARDAPGRRPRRRAARRPRRRDRIGEWQQGLRAALRRAGAAALRRRPVEECAVAIVVCRRPPQMESAARSDALLQSEDAPGDRSAGKLSWRRVTRGHSLVPDGRAHRSRLRRCAARSRG